MRGSHGLSAQRARRTKSGGPKGLQLEFGAQRAPRLLVVHISWHCILVKLHFCILGETVFLSVPGGEDEEGLGGDQHPAGGHCPQPQEETPGRELCCSYFLFDLYQNVPNIILLDINFPKRGWFYLKENVFQDAILEMSEQIDQLGKLKAR